MAYPNQYYQPNYMVPQYQNFQAQQRQEQLDQLYTRPYAYNYVRDENEARNWPTAPGNHLVFENQNGQYFYTKSLGFGPNEKPVFIVYKREDFVEQSQETETVEQNSLQEQIEKYKSSTDLEINNLRVTLETLNNSITELRESFKNNSKPHFDKYNKKGGRE